MNRRHWSLLRQQSQRIVSYRRRRWCNNEIVVASRSRHRWNNHIVSSSYRRSSHHWCNNHIVSWSHRWHRWWNTPHDDDNMYDDDRVGGMGMVLPIEGDNHSGSGDDLVISILLNGITTTIIVVVVDSLSSWLPSFSSSVVDCWILLGSNKQLTWLPSLLSWKAQQWMINNSTGIVA